MALIRVKETMKFSDVIGHEKEISILKRAMASGRVAHAYLFSGPEGVGKRLVARSFAAALNCEKATDEACGECRACLEASTGKSRNLLYLEAEEGLIRIERIRELQEALRYRAEGWKAAIVDGADRMVAAAANAFLKTLEEPPPSSVIILVTSRASECLPTILSRCQRVVFRPLSTQAVKAYLMEKRGLGAEEADTIARLSAGSLSRAIEYSGGVIERRSEVTGRIGSLRGDDAYGLMKAAEELSKMDGLADVLEDVKTYIRDMAVALAGRPDLAVTPGMKDVGQRADLRVLCDAFSTVEAARRDITPPRYANRLLAMESMLLGLSGKGRLL